MGVQSVLAKITLCRTAALGGRWYSCEECGETTKLHNSCGDRHCPGCSGAKRSDFNERASQLIVTGVDHYQVIFTVPEIISAIALANRTEIADLIFKSAWKALKKTITSEQGYEPAALMVLHTWNQKLDAHWHVHALVPGAGPDVAGDGVRQARSPQTGHTGQYLVDAIALRNAYRKAFLRGLKKLYRNGKLSFSGSTEHLRDEGNWDELLARLDELQWVSHIEPPPSELSQAKHVVSYLTRYVTGGPISNHRIVSATRDEVTFWLAKVTAQADLASKCR
ncbi:IS91 family transposase [Rhodopirellula baltica]|nr:IS91 family transposase [Rhodopirellula baltica]